MLSKYSRWRLGSKNKPGVLTHTQKGVRKVSKNCVHQNFCCKFEKLFLKSLLGPFINGIVHCDPLTLLSKGESKTFPDSKILGPTNMTSFLEMTMSVSSHRDQEKFKCFNLKEKTVNSHHRSSPGHRSSSSSSSSSSRIGLID